LVVIATFVILDDEHVARTIRSMERQFLPPRRRFVKVARAVVLAFAAAGAMFVMAPGLVKTVHAGRPDRSR
jgi:hypothetical protein